MFAHEATDDDFVLVRASTSVAQVRELLERVAATNVIVHRVDETAEYYYLFTTADVRDRLRGASGAAAVGDPQGLDLHEHESIPAVDTNSEKPPPLAVVLEEGRVVGFIAARLDAPGGASRHVWGGPPLALGDQTVTRSLEAVLPEQVPLETTVSLLVSLSTSGQKGDPSTFTIMKGATVDVVVHPGSGLELIGNGEGSLQVTDAASLPIQFKLKAISLGPSQLQVYAFHQGQPLGVTRAACTVVAATGKLGAQRSAAGQLVPVNLRQPDLYLTIFELPDGGRPTIELRLTTADRRYSNQQFGPIQLRLNPLDYFRDFFQDIEGLPLQTKQDRIAAQTRLIAKGAWLFENLIPADLREILWRVKEQIQTIRVESEEPWIPWELCRMTGVENGRKVEGDFLCEAYAITRGWMGRGQPAEFTLNNVALVVPTDSGLPYAKSERDFILSLGNKTRHVNQVPATYLEVRTALASGQYDAWHFSGHGAVTSPDPDRAVMSLQGGDELTPEELSGEVTNLGIPRPFVFLNACQIGRSAMGLTDIGGWAARFLEAGAAAFIGAYWSVFDQAANDFAQDLYRRLLAGTPIGTATKEARAAIKPLDDPTWLAYTVYADPFATLKEKQPTRQAGPAGRMGRNVSRGYRFAPERPEAG